MNNVVSLEDEILLALEKAGRDGADLQIIQDQCGLGSGPEVVSCLKQLCAAGKAGKHGARHYFIVSKGVAKVITGVVDGADDLAFLKKDQPIGIDKELEMLARKVKLQPGITRIELKKKVLDRLSSILAGDIAEVLYEISNDLERLHG